MSELAPHGKTCVYFIADPERGRIKIGTTRMLKKRLYTLGREYGDGLKLIGWKPGSAAIEKAVHVALVAHHIELEWFRDCPEVRALAEASEWPDEIRAYAHPTGAAGRLESLSSGRAMDEPPPPLPDGPITDRDLNEMIQRAVGFVVLHESNAAAGMAPAMSAAAAVLGLTTEQVERYWYSGLKSVPASHMVVIHVNFIDYLAALRQRLKDFDSSLELAIAVWSKRCKYDLELREKYPEVFTATADSPADDVG